MRLLLQMGQVMKGTRYGAFTIGKNRGIHYISSCLNLFILGFYFSLKKKNGGSSNAKAICNRLLFEELEKVKIYCMRNVNIFIRLNVSVKSYTLAACVNKSLNILVRQSRIFIHSIHCPNPDTVQHYIVGSPYLDFFHSIHAIALAITPPPRTITTMIQPAFSSPASSSFSSVCPGSFGSLAMLSGSSVG